MGYNTILRDPSRCMSGNEGKTQPLAPVFVDCSFDGSGKARLKIPLPQVAGAICE